MRRNLPLIFVGVAFLVFIVALVVFLLMPAPAPAVVADPLSKGYAAMRTEATNTARLDYSKDFVSRVDKDLAAQTLDINSVAREALPLIPKDAKELNTVRVTSGSVAVNYTSATAQARLGSAEFYIFYKWEKGGYVGFSIAPGVMRL